MQDVKYIPGLEATNFNKLFMRWDAFHKAFPKGIVLAYGPHDHNDRTFSNEVATGLGQLSTLQRQLVVFQRDLLGAEPTVQGIIKQFLAATPSGAAQSCLERPDLKSLCDFDYAEICRRHAEVIEEQNAGAAKDAPPAEALPQPAPAPPVQELPSSQKAKEGTDDGSKVEHFSVPEEQDPLPRTNSQRVFELLHLQAGTADSFDRLPAEQFDAIYRSAADRIDMFVELWVRPEDPSRWREAMLSTVWFRTRGEKDRTLFVIDPKNFKRAPARPWSRPPVFPTEHVDGIYNALFSTGLAEAEREKTMIYSTKGLCSINGGMYVCMYGWMDRWMDGWNVRMIDLVLKGCVVKVEDVNGQGMVIHNQS